MKLIEKQQKIVKDKTKKKGRPPLIYKRKHKDIEIKKYLFKHSNCSKLEDIKVKKVKRKYQLRYIKEQSIKHRVAYRDTDDTLLFNNLKKLNYLKNSLDIK